MNERTSIPDWSRESPRRFWDPGRKLLKSLRAYQRTREQTGLYALLVNKICVVRHQFWSAVSGADIPLNSNLGGGLLLPHPNGVVVHPSATVGANCLLFQQTTLTRNVVLGDWVDVGAGAKLLGAVTVGSNVQVGANAVVLSDVESNSVVAGIPAKVVG